MLTKRQKVRNEIDTKRNHSWAEEIFRRHSKELGRVLIDYFDNQIPYAKILDESMKMAKSLKLNGAKKGDEIVVCLDRIPELVYLVMAASIIGAKINIISDKFDKEYIKSIITDANYKFVFIQKNKLDKMEDVIKDLHDKHEFVTVSHERSLPENHPYDKIFERFYKKDVDLPEYELIDYDKFIQDGLDYDDLSFEKVDLDDPFTVTYSSGTTKKGFPKGITHKIRHYITMGRYHDPEVSGIPSLKNYSTYSNIPSYSNSFILSAMSDIFILGGKCVLDPIDDPDYFLVGAKIHNSNVNIATTTVWLRNAMNYYNGDKYNIGTLPYAMFNFVAGEGFSAGEEKFLNRFFKDTKCGIKVTHTPVSLSKACVAGADCEHGSVFMKMFRALFNKAPYRIGRSEPVGMKPYDFVDVQILRKDGTYCLPLEHGRIVANSDCTMLGYNHNPEATEKFFIKDAYGKVWGDMKVYGFYDEKGNVSMKGRYSDDDLIPTYLIADEILKDTKKIMSCEVVPAIDNGRIVYVAHIMPQYRASFNTEKVIKGAIQRCIKKFGFGIQDILFFRIRSYIDNYPVSASSKRDILALESEGLDKVYYSEQKVASKQKVLVR